MPNETDYQKVCQQNKRLTLLLSETEAIYHEAAKRLGLSDSTMKILYTICNLGPNCPLADIIRLSGCAKQTVNSSLRKLEEENVLYLENTVGRRKNVCLTEKGQKLVENTVLRLIELENQLMLNWTEQETAIYINLTQRFLQDFKEHIKKL